MFSGIGAWSLILFAWAYLEHVLYLAPCPLCMMQRLAFFLVGLMFMIEAIFWPEKPFADLLMKLFKFSAIFLGIGLAARHIWIQNLPPDQIPACGFDFWGTLDQKGFWGGLLQSMKGTGDCAVPDKFLWFTIPTWSLAAFIGLLLVAIFCGKNKKH
ncbi:disulfide bond formation protein B [Suttonella ornithocola]|nr:disulfide bond formation protein B [Suttonella ornithocola]